MVATITELRPIKRRVLIMVDGRRFACVPRAWVDELQLAQFDEVDADELGQAIAARQFEGAYAYALDLLAASMRTRKQVLTKLAGSAWPRAGCWTTRPTRRAARS